MPNTLDAIVDLMARSVAQEVAVQVALEYEERHGRLPVGTYKDFRKQGVFVHRRW